MQGFMHVELGLGIFAIDRGLPFDGGTSAVTYTSILRPFVKINIRSFNRYLMCVHHSF